MNILNFLECEAANVHKLFPNNFFKLSDGISYWYRQGTNGILLVAHVDTITRCNDIRQGKKQRELKINISEAGIITAENSVLGADDRAGCYSIKKIIEHLTECSVLLTNFEESGGVGVKKFISDNPRLLKHYKIFLEFDREGLDQVVCYHDEDPALIDLVSEYGFNLEQGSYSDVKDLSDVFQIHHLNLSVGYSRQHSTSEYLDFANLEYVLIPRYIQIIKKLVGLDRVWLKPADLFKPSYIDNSETNYLICEETELERILNDFEYFQELPENDLKYLEFEYNMSRFEVLELLHAQLKKH